MNKTARIIVNYCIQNNIGNIVVGYNLDWKHNINIGSCNNQNFAQIPHGNLLVKMKSLCERYGINYVEQEESYTSQADFFANDTLLFTTQILHKNTTLEASAYLGVNTGLIKVLL